MNDDITPESQDIDRTQLSHDLRTPLTVARGYAELIGRKLAAPDPDLHRVAEMNRKLLAQLQRLEAAIYTALDTPDTHHPERRPRTPEQQ